MIIKYQSSVCTPAGWRGVTILAKATQISPGMARVDAVTEIDGEPPVGTLSRTGARRQEFYAPSIVKREIGLRKRLSACTIVE